MTLALRSASCLLGAFVLVALAAGCGGKSIGDDLTTTPDPNNPNNPNNPNDPSDPSDPNQPCATIAAVCDPGDEKVPDEKSCGTADYCYSRAQACNGGVIWCAHRTVQCDAIPTCNDGDAQVTSCPGGAGISCYPRTACGTTILCMHRDACKALPSCDAGDKEVVDIATCQQPGAKCYSRTACSFTIWCHDISN